VAKHKRSELYQNVIEEDHARRAAVVWLAISKHSQRLLKSQSAQGTGS